MARNELTNLIKAEIHKYLGIPYFINKPGQTSPLNALVGKGTYHEIAQATVAAAQKLGVDLTRFTAKEIYNFEKKNRIGIDCSGLAYHLLDKLYQLKNNKSIEECLIGTEAKKGVRRLSANLLTGPDNSSPVADYSKVKLGDLVRMDKGKHVVFIIQKTGNKISYVHSSDKTKARGVHLGLITITNPTLPLNQQQWTDETVSGLPYSSLVYPDAGDGIYRLNCLK